MFALSSGKASTSLKHTGTVEKSRLVQADPAAEKMAALLDEFQKGGLPEDELVAKLKEMQAQ